MLTAWRSLPSNLDSSGGIVTCASLGFVYDTKAGLAAVTFSSVILRAERAVPTMVWICYNNNNNVVAIFSCSMISLNMRKDAHRSNIQNAFKLHQTVFASMNNFTFYF